MNDGRNEDGELPPAHDPDRLVDSTRGYGPDSTPGYGAPPPRQPDADGRAAPPSARGPLTAAKLTGSEEPEIPMEDFGKRGSKKKVVVIALLAIVLVGGAAGTFGFFQNRGARARTEAAFGDLSQCLVGEASGSIDEVAVKYRSHQVAFMTRESQDRSDGSGAWPERCAVHAKKLIDAADAAGLESDEKSLVNTASELATALQEKRLLSSDATPLLRATWEAASQAKIRPAKSAVSGPPAHPAAMVLDDVPESAFIAPDFVPLKSLGLPHHPSEEPIFFVDRKDGAGPFSCRVEAARLACKKVAPALAKLGHALTLLGSADPGMAPLLFAGNRGDAGIFRADTGKQVERFDGMGGYHRKDGTIILLGIVDRKVNLSVLGPNDESPKRYVVADELTKQFGEEQDTGNGFYTIQIAHGFMFVRTWKEEDRGWKLWALPLGADGRPQKPVLIGLLPGLVPYSGDQPGLIACRTTDDRRVVRAHGDDEDFVSFLADGTWTRPTTGIGLAEGRMHCSDNRAVFAAASWMQSCTSSGCKGEVANKGAVTMGDLAPRGGADERAPLEDGMLAFWAAGTRGGVRARTGAPGSLDKAQESVLFDDLVFGAKLSELPTVTELRVLSAGSFAEVLMQTKKGLVAMRYSEGKGLLPDTVVWE